MISVRDLNIRLRESGVTPERRHEIKQDRRTLKNRLYAEESRLREMEQMAAAAYRSRERQRERISQLEDEVLLLREQLRQRENEVATLQEQNQIQQARIQDYEMMSK